MYEVVSISGHYVLHNSERSLWCSKIDAGIIPSSPTILDESLDPVCLGTCYGIVGKIQFLPESPENLILITERELVCNLFGAPVYRVKDVVVLPLSLETPYLDLPTCEHHGKPPRGEDVSDSDTKLERKLEDEFVKWFEKSFYYSETADITHTTLERAEKRYTKGMPLWRKVKEEYFWNRTMLECLIENSDENSDAWILPLMQGYIERKEVSKDVTLTLVSRRNKYRAGFRFKRRGIDDKGHVANFVITEQMLRVGRREFALELVRGSVPVFWYQPLTNYRPKPVITSPREESLEAFKIHMDPLITRYEKVVVVNLLDSEGKESCLGDEYAKVAYMYNNEHLTYVAFDFNEYCAGMRFDNVKVLLNELTGITNNYSFTELADGCLMGEQEGVIRVNCMDSLDRTNVVQGAIAKKSLMTQIEGIPDVPLDDLIQASKLLWANNGDAISTQYAGTAALKGDYTRTGERGVAGMMRDGVSSVTRMYINVFRDTYRQAAIDIMQNVELDLAAIREEQEEELEFVPALISVASVLLPPSPPPPKNKSWVVQEWPSGEGKVVTLTPEQLVLVHEVDSQDACSLTAVDRLHIGQPPECLGHYLRLHLANKAVTVRPLEAGTNMRDALMKMAHAIVSYRDNLNLNTNVVHGPLSKNADLVDMGIDKIKSSANRIAAGAKKMIGGITGDKSSSPESGDERSPRFGRKMFNMFRRDESDNSSPSPPAVVPPSIRMSDVITRDVITRDVTRVQPVVTASTVQLDCSECEHCNEHPPPTSSHPPKANPLSFLQTWKPTKSQILYFNSSTLQVATGDNTAGDNNASNI